MKVGWQNHDDLRGTFGLATPNQVIRNPLSVSGTAIADFLQFKENPDAWFIVEDTTEGITPTNQALAGHR